VTVATAAPKDGRVIVLLAPWRGGAETLDVIGRAGGRLVAGSRFEWAAVADDGHTDFVAQLYAAGALLVLDGTMFTGCGTGTTGS
jgi:hypothetical protein